MALSALKKAESRHPELFKRAGDSQQTVLVEEIFVEPSDFGLSHAYADKKLVGHQHLADEYLDLKESTAPKKQKTKKEETQPKTDAKPAATKEVHPVESHHTDAQKPVKSKTTTPEPVVKAVNEADSESSDSSEDSSNDSD